MSKNLALLGARIVDPTTGVDAMGNVYVNDGVVSREAGTDGGYVTYDCRGLVLCPAFIDLHCHLREPGFEGKETVASGSAAAVAGGFASVCAMPNTRPAYDSVENAVLIEERHSSGQCVHVYRIAAVTVGREGRELVDVGALSQYGVVGFSDDGGYVWDAVMMRDALTRAKDFELPIIDHAQDDGLVAGGVMHEGDVSRRIGVPGMPAEAEELAVARDIALARLTGGHVHIAHVTTARALRIVKVAKAEGLHVTTEVTPHHLMLTDEDAVVRGQDGHEAFNNNAKVNPPLRTKADTAALQQGLMDGTIDAIATDHAPHTMADKSGSPAEAAFGISAFETALGVAVTLCHQGALTLECVIDALTVGPTRVLAGHGPPTGLARGEPAEFVLFDPNDMDCG
ncbi:dihydroorotase [Chloroflexota bacterium]